MGRFIIPLVVLAVTVYGIVDCAQADDRNRKGIPLWAWIVMMVLLPGVGAIIWLITSRLGTAGSSAPRRGPVAPDDDPEFLRELEWRNRRNQRQKPAGSDSADEGTGDDQADGDKTTDPRPETDTDRPTS